MGIFFEHNVIQLDPQGVAAQPFHWHDLWMKFHEIHVLYNIYMDMFFEWIMDICGKTTETKKKDQQFATLHSKTRLWI